MEHNNYLTQQKWGTSTPQKDSFHWPNRSLKAYVLTEQTLLIKDQQQRR